MGDKHVALGCIFEVHDTGACPATTCDTEVPTLTMTIGVSQAARAVPMVLAAALLVPAAASAASSIDEPVTADAVSPAVSVVGPNFIGFESDTAGDKAEPFASVDNPTVQFVDTLGDDLNLSDYGDQSNGQALAVNGDDASALVMRFDVPTKRVALTFGNDDPGYSQEGDEATLTVFRFGKRIATVNVVMNRNDLGDQVIQYRGRVPVNRAKLVYTRAGVPINLIEIVDDIKLRQACSIRGNSGPNRIVGNAAANGICAFGGNDQVLGKAGNDVLSGAAGNDRLNGGAGNDLLKGGPGDDTLRTTDGVGGNDTAYGGPGDDTCIVDVGDQTYSCETVINPT